MGGFEQGIHLPPVPRVLVYSLRHLPIITSVALTMAQRASGVSEAG